MTAATTPRLSASTWATGPGPLTRADLITATLAWMAITLAFWLVSHGNSLRVTFVPGVAAAYLITVFLWRAGRPVPAGRVALPWFFVALAVQFVHFAEENATGFATKFPAMYGGNPYGAEAFVTFNMSSYAAFTIAAIGLWCLGVRQLVIPVLFFCVYGTFGNACAHLWWAIQAGRYFPGLYTSLLYWVLGPILIHTFLGQKRLTGIFAVAYMAMAVTLLTAFQTQAP